MGSTHPHTYDKKEGRGAGGVVLRHQGTPSDPKRPQGTPSGGKYHKKDIIFYKIT
jgi:hypothetical protein